MRTRVVVGMIVMAAASIARGQQPMAVEALKSVSRHAPDTGSYSWSTGTYRYDAAGNIISIGEQIFRYDTNGRLTSATIEGPDQVSHSVRSFAYDAYGNMTQKVSDGLPATINPSQLTNQLPAPAGYDESGSLTSWQPPGSGNTYAYEYDALGMMTTIRINTAVSPQFYMAYTADDQRYFRYDNGPFSSEMTIRDLNGNVLRRTDRVVSGLDGQGNRIFASHVSRDYVYGGSTLLAANAPFEGRVEHFSLDHLGTPRLITDAGRNKIGYHVYAPFGEEWLPANITQEGDAKKFTGHERDRDLGEEVAALDYMHARYYGAAVGRFLSVDPVLNVKRACREPQNWNRYSYVGNNPLRYTDPDGRDRYQEPGFTKPMTAGNLAMDENTPAVIRGAVYAEGALLLPATADFLGVGELYGTVRAFIRLVRGAREEPTIRPDVKVSGGRSGQDVKTTTGPPNSVIRGSDGRVYQTNDKGQIIADITRERVKPVMPGQGFGPKRAPTEQELGWLEKMARAIRDLAK